MLRLNNWHRKGEMVSPICLSTKHGRWSGVWDFLGSSVDKNFSIVSCVISMSFKRWCWFSLHGVSNVRPSSSVNTEWNILFNSVALSWSLVINSPVSSFSGGIDSTDFSFLFAYLKNADGLLILHILFSNLLCHTLTASLYSLDIV